MKRAHRWEVVRRKDVLQEAADQAAPARAAAAEHNDLEADLLAASLAPPQPARRGPRLSGPLRPARRRCGAAQSEPAGREGARPASPGHSGYSIRQGGERDPTADSPGTPERSGVETMSPLTEAPPGERGAPPPAAPPSPPRSARITRRIAAQQLELKERRARVCLRCSFSTTLTAQNR
jgi:hypothetical protein